MATEVIVGVLCGVGVGMLLGLFYWVIFIRWKRRENNKIKAKIDDQFNVRGRTIIARDIPDFRIPPTIPVPAQTPVQRRETTTPASSPNSLSPSPRSPGHQWQESRRCSVALEDILTNKPNLTVRKLSPQTVQSTNEAAIESYSKIQKKMKQKRSTGSSALGKLEFSLFYDQGFQELQIYVVRGIQVYQPGSDGPSDLILTAVILFDGQEVWKDKTKVVQPSVDPEFGDQLIVHGLTVNRMRLGALKLTIINNSTNVSISEVIYPLSSLPFNLFTTEVVKLSEVEADDTDWSQQAGDTKYGELLVSMSHNPNDKKLSVRLEGAKGLQMKYRGNTDSFVKVEILFVGHKLHSRTSRVVYKSLNPEYNEEFEFDIPEDKLPQITVVFKVKHHGKMRNNPIGIVKLGYTADRETEYRHWEQVLDKPHLRIENWHKISKYR